MTSGNYAFDQRVAGRYNQQRAHPPEVAQAIGAGIAAEVGAGGRVLEIGIGTGRIAQPVRAAGCTVIGFDISGEMLQEAQSLVGGEGASLALLQADMHRLPFVAQGFDGVLAVHVLHLAKDWQAVIREAGRVLRPGGVFIQGDDWIDPQSVTGRLRDELRAWVIRTAPNMQPPAAGVSRAELLAELGGTTQGEVIAAEWTVEVSPAERLDAYANRLDAESWMLPPHMFDAALAHLRDFAAGIWTDLDTPQPVTRRFILKTARGDWH